MPTPSKPTADRRSSERKEAEWLYLESKGSMKLVEIAEKLKLPASKIRKWKSLDGWEAKLNPDKSKKKQVERSTSEKGNAPPKKSTTKKGNAPRKKGAPYGNQNNKGGRGNPHPTHIINATKHGAYRPLFYDCLDEDEKAFLEGIPKDEEQLLEEQIALYGLRERRIMQAINKYRQMNGELIIADVTKFENKRAFENEEDEEEYKRRQAQKVAEGKILPGRDFSIQTHTSNRDMQIARLEQELNSVQRAKTKAIEALAKIRLEKQKISGDTSANDLVKEWADKILTAREVQHE